MSTCIIENETKGLTAEEIRFAIQKTIKPAMKKVLLVPPDGTRAYSGAGMITNMYYHMFMEAGVQVDILPALGTHAPMNREQLAHFFGDIPAGCFLTHKWRDGVTSMGDIPREYVRTVTEGLSEMAIPVDVSDYLLDASYEHIFSIGQVVPHEVVGIANFTKNIVVGCGGSSFINASHWVGASYGIERILGRVDTPVRKLFDYAEEKYISKLPLTYVLTVTLLKENNEADILGLYVSDEKNRREAFEKAAALSQKRNLTFVERPIQTCVIWLDAHEFHSTWLGNKAVYRARMAMAQGGRIIILAPAVTTFGEDAENDRLIRKYGYTGRERILSLSKTEADLQNNLSAAAHMIHGSSDGMFDVYYAAPLLGKAAIEGVGYQYAEFDAVMEKYKPGTLRPGFNSLENGEEVYFIQNPSLGLWSLPF